MSTPVDEIEGGEYELTAVLWDQVISKPGQPFDFVRHRRGDVIVLDVEEARRLVVAGAVVKPGEDHEAERLGLAESHPPDVDPADVVDERTDPSDPNRANHPGGAGGEGGFDLANIAGSNAAEVLAWVGDDQAKARQALEAEQGRGDSARKGLTADLTSLTERQG